jgi:hypothetical protein
MGKTTGRGESIGAVICISMGTTQGNSLCTIFISNCQKHHVSLFNFFFFYKIREQEDGKGSAQGEAGKLVPVGGGVGRERGRRMNTVQTIYTHVCKCKNDTH